jgi:hypothetical protein
MNNFPTLVAFLGGAMAGSYLVRRYIFKEHRKFEPIKLEHVQNEVAIGKTKLQEVNTHSDSPYAALYSKK